MGRRLRKIRHAAEYPDGMQKEYAKLLKIGYNAYNNYETGKRLIPANTLLRLIARYPQAGLTYDWVYRESAAGLSADLYKRFRSNDFD